MIGNFLMNGKRKGNFGSSGPRGKGPMPRMNRRAVEEDDESITSEDEVRSLAASEPEQDEFFEETADEKRVRLAKAYLEEVGERVGAGSSDEDSAGSTDEASDEDEDEDRVDAALRRDLAVQQQRVKFSVTPSLQVGSSQFVRSHGNSVTCVRVAPCSADAAGPVRVASVGKDGRLVVYTEIPVSGEFRRTLELKVDESPLYALAWVSGNLVAVAGESKTIFLVSLAQTSTGTVTARLRSHQGRVTGLACVTAIVAGAGESETRLISVGADKAVKQWLIRGEGGSYMESYFGHTGEIQGISVLRDAPVNTPVTCGFDNSARVWSLDKDSHKVFPTTTAGASPDCVAAIDAKHFITGANGEATLWGVSYRKFLAKISSDSLWVTAVGALSNTDLAAIGEKRKLRFLRTGSAGPGTAAKNGKATKAKMTMEIWGEEVAVPGIVNDVSFAPSGNLVALAVGRDQRLGRWLVDERGKNGVLLVRLSHAVAELQAPSLQGPSAAGAAGAAAGER